MVDLNFPRFLKYNHFRRFSGQLCGSYLPLYYTTVCWMLCLSSQEAKVIGVLDRISLARLLSKICLREETLTSLPPQSIASEAG